VLLGGRGDDAPPTSRDEDDWGRTPSQSRPSRAPERPAGGASGGGRGQGDYDDLDDEIPF
jgi:hypothetical protein